MKKTLFGLLAIILSLSLMTVCFLNVCAVNDSSSFIVSGVSLSAEIIYSPFSSFGLSIFSDVATYSINPKPNIYTTGGCLIPTTIEEPVEFDEYYSSNAYAAEECPNAIRLEDPTADYNCHFYAWYSQEIDVDSDFLHWIPTADVFINQDQHREFIGDQDDVENGLQLEYGTIATYWIGEQGGTRICVHSAYVVDVDSDGNVICESKWGRAGLYEHALDEVPWIYLNIATQMTPDVEYYRYVQGEHDCTFTSENMDEHYADCVDCDYAEYESHSGSYSSVSDAVHLYTCADCGYYGYASHNKQYYSYSDSQHRVRCYICSYSAYENHDLYMYSAEPEDYVVKCHDCTYSIECWESPEYYGDSENGHWVDCPCGCYSFFEAHTPGSYSSTEEGSHNVVCADCGYLYSEDCSYVCSGIGNLYYHTLECSVCGENDTEPHDWIRVGTKYRCLVCGRQETIIPTDVMSLSDEELSLLLSSMSEEELGEFIALLPEDAVARVTAILPRDDEHLTE